MEATRKAVNALQEGLGQSDIDPAQMTGKQDPYLLKLVVDRQVERQIDEENYLHQVNKFFFLLAYGVAETLIGVSQPRSIWTRIRSHCRRRDPEVL